MKKTNETSPEMVCRKCNGNGKLSSGIMNFHNIQFPYDGSKSEFETKVLDCIKCESCGHSWIPKSGLSKIYVTVVTSGMSVLVEKVRVAYLSNQNVFDVCSDFANKVAKESGLEWSKVLFKYYRNVNDDVSVINYRLPNKPSGVSKLWFNSLIKKDQEMLAGVYYNNVPSELSDANIQTIFDNEKMMDKLVLCSKRWFNMKSSLEKTRLCDTNTEIVGHVRRYETLTDEEIIKIWLSEQKVISLTDKKVYTQEEVDRMLDEQAAKTAAQILGNGRGKNVSDDVFNLSNPVKFSVEELKDFSESFAKMIFERGNGWDLTGFWDMCREKFYDKFKSKEYLNKRVFNEYLFKSYIDKLPSEERGNMIGIISRKMSKDELRLVIDALSKSMENRD